WRHLRDRDHKAEIARGWLAQRDDVNALAIDFDFQMIDSVVVVEHFARNLAVAFSKRVHRALERLLRFAAEQQHAIAQGTQFVVEMTMRIHNFVLRTLFFALCSLPATAEG